MSAEPRDGPPPGDPGDGDRGDGGDQGGSGSDPGRGRDQGYFRRTLPWLPVLAPAVAVALWAFSLGRFDLPAMGATGLVSVMPATYAIALAVLLAGVVAEIVRPAPRPWLLAVQVAVLILVLHGTLPLLYREPRYTYVYKHIAVSRYIEAHGRVDRSIEIYQNWSGFPGAVAYLSTVTGLDPMSFANWAQAFFAAANALAVRFAVRALTREARIVALAVVVYLLGDWVGQGYFAPQALAFLVSLVAIGVVLRFLPPTAHPPGVPSPTTVTEARPRRTERLRRLWRSLVAGVPAIPPDGRMTRRAAGLLAAVLSAVVVLTHPLSPFVVLGWLAALVLLGRFRLWWLPLFVGVVALGWTLAAHGWLSEHVNLFADVGSAAANAQGTSQAGAPVPAGHQLVGEAARVLTLGVWAGAAYGYWHRYRSGHRDATAPVLAAVPFSMVLAQSYGGEIIYRVLLFSVPWCSFLIAAALLEDRPRHPVRRAVTVGGVLAIMASLFLFAYFGLEQVNHVQSDEVAASVWFEEHTPPGSVLTLLTSNFPTEVTANYDQHRTPWGTFGGTLIDQDPRFKGRELTQADVPAVLAYLHEFGDGDVYLVLSPGQETQAWLFGDAPPGAVSHFSQILLAQPGIEVVYRTGDVTIVKLPPP